MDRKEYMKIYRMKNRTKIKGKSLEYYSKHREEILRKRKLYYLKNYKSELINNRKWRQQNPTKSYINTKKWREKYPEKLKEYLRKANSNRKAAGILTLEMLERLRVENIKEYGILTCIYCMENVEGRDTLEHLVPISNGGTNNFDNLAIACKKCNSCKGDKTYDEFIKYKSVADLSNKHNVSLKQCAN